MADAASGTWPAMKYIPAMLVNGPYDEATLPKCARMLRHVAVHAAIFAGAATAGEHVRNTLIPAHIEASAATISTLDAKTFSATDFRPRARSIFDAAPLSEDTFENPMLQGTRAWQRLRDYQGHSRIRLLTLWESRTSTLSLQASKTGYPSLQWTSRWMSRKTSSDITP